MDSKKILVSFCLKSYNQKEFLKEALEGAFSQTYRPLEIVISDDESTDGSVDLILNRVRQWNDGCDGSEETDAEKSCDIVRFPEKDGVSVVVLLNKKNLGNLGNWQRICEFARGELFVKADGDDVSLPERTEKVVGAWVNDGKKALIVANRGWKMDWRGRVYGMMDNTGAGAVSAYSRRLYEEFGPIVVYDRLAYDDYVYALRMKILGGRELLVDSRLVRYRMGSGVSSAFQGYRRTMAKTFMSAMASHRQSVVDATAHGVELGMLTRYEELIKLWSGNTLHERWDGCKKLGSMHSGSLRMRLLAMLLLMGRLSDPILDFGRITKLLVDKMLWLMLLRMKFLRENDEKVV